MHTRGKTFLAAIASYVIGLVVCGTLLGVRNLYAGEPPRVSGERVTGTVQVGACDRVGPASAAGFGYWWYCEITVTLPDGRAVAAVVGPSVVTPDDRGRPPALVGYCSRTEPDDCSFTREGRNLFLGLLGWFAMLLSLAALVCTAFVGGTALLIALLGPARVERWFGRRSPEAAQTPPPAEPSPDDSPYEPLGALPPGTGSLRIRFWYPEPATQVYQQARPRLSVDATDLDVLNWSTHRFPLAPGPRRMEVSAVLPEGAVFGTVTETVTVLDGVETVVDYEAPANLTSSGVLRVGAAQDDAGTASVGDWKTNGRFLLAVAALNVGLCWLLSILR
ncbi:DUF6346 domain-containing protein [Micromonospora sp. WMMD1102]|uniref:DUF6346 domain-containing protein n=1 Tax=Micromonospora sp. WMMD1102 TaxID=3016105 RepID=UPI00241545D1|nr:DUF6346 domain-containing protein [Micromonospora sp. WMMD1102]MDG4785252.1 DUF6346 domain-containing protein [Micromonospora sp. WMMD1102]